MIEEISKEYVQKKIENMINDENKVVLNSFVKLLQSIPDNKWNEFINQHGMTIENLEKVITNKMNVELQKEKSKSLNVEDEKNFKVLNDFISYGISNNTFHLHIIPKDVRDMLNSEGLLRINIYLIDALDKIKDILKNDEFKNINTIFAVSPILRLSKLQDMFKELNFDVEQTKHQNLLDKFLDAKSVYQANLPKEVFFTQEWDKNKESILKETITELNNKKYEHGKFKENLKSLVNNEITIKDDKNINTIDKNTSYIDYI
ncbi:MAG: hypothetical protein PHD15_06290 [Clostridia bacterium]|nr:hypothetical protein [Clostridia bacterium]MDD4387339.1 hypothetical protein [Clostridia bacterium]